MLMQEAATIWKFAVQTSIIVAGICCGLLVGMSIRWTFDTQPLFIENPTPGTQYMETPYVVAGGFAVMHRSLRRTDDCPAKGGIWIIGDRGAFPVKNYLSFSDLSSSLAFIDQRIIFEVPPNWPKGKYEGRLYVSCQRNPLTNVGQRLVDLPFEVVTPPK